MSWMQAATENKQVILETIVCSCERYYEDKLQKYTNKVDKIFLSFDSFPNIHIYLVIFSFRLSYFNTNTYLSNSDLNYDFEFAIWDYQHMWRIVGNLWTQVSFLVFSLNQL